MQRGSAQLLLVFVFTVLILLGGYFYLSSNKSPKNILPEAKPATQNITSKTLLQNTYSNQNLGFEFIIPKNLTAKADMEEEFNKRGNGDYRKNFTGYVGYEPPVFLGAVAVLDETGLYDKNPFSLWVFDNPDNLSPEKWFNSYWYYPFVWGVFDYTSKGHIALDAEATISGELAKSKIVAYQPGEPKFIYVSKNNKMYLFRIIKDSKNTGEQILFSFKFIQ